MARQNRILSIGIILNFCVYLAAAVFFGHQSSSERVNQFARYVASAGRSVLFETGTTVEMAKAMLDEYYDGKRTFGEVNAWSPSRLYDLVELAENRKESAHPIIKSKVNLTIPLALLRAREFNFIRYAADKNLYLTMGRDNTDSGLTEFPQFTTMRVNHKQMIEDVEKMSMTFAIIEYNQDMKPFVIYSGLKKEDLKDFQATTEDLTHKNIVAYAAADATPDAYKSVIIATLSGTRRLIYPYVLSSNEKIQQVIYFVLTLPVYHLIDQRSFVLFIFAVFTVSLGILSLGLIGTSKQKIES
jgi:hypothetical protein